MPNIANHSNSRGTNLTHAWYHLGDLITARRRSTALLHLPFSITSFLMLKTTVFSASSGIYTVGQGILSTVSLKKVFTPRRDVLINGKDFQVILMILSSTSLFKNCPVYPDPTPFCTSSSFLSARLIPSLTVSPFCKVVPCPRQFWEHNLHPLYLCLIIKKNLKANSTPTLFTRFPLTMTFPLLSRQNVFWILYIVKFGMSV